MCLPAYVYLEGKRDLDRPELTAIVAEAERQDELGGLEVGRRLPDVLFRSQQVLLLDQLALDHPSVHQLRLEGPRRLPGGAGDALHAGPLVEALLGGNLLLGARLPEPEGGGETALSDLIVFFVVFRSFLFFYVVFRYFLFFRCVSFFSLFFALFRSFFFFSLFRSFLSLFFSLCFVLSSKTNPRSCNYEYPTLQKTKQNNNFEIN